MSKLENVCKNFGDLQVLKNVNLEVREGEKPVLSAIPLHGKIMQSMTVTLMIGILIGMSVNTFQLPRERNRDILFISGLDDTLLNENSTLHALVRQRHCR